MTPTRVEKKDIQVLISAQKIAERVTSLADEIAAALPKDLVIVGLLRGSFVFASDLIRALHEKDLRPQMDFVTLSSYGARATSSGEIRVIRDLTDDVEGRDVLIVDDILESGLTLTFARNLLMERKAKSVKIAVLLEKPGKRRVKIDADFVGFSIEDKFVVGYGLDYAGYYRELPFIGVVPTL